MARFSDREMPVKHEGLTPRLFHVDSFTTEPMTGNPAAVVVLPAPPADGAGQRTGAELNEPATAVVWPAGEPGRFGLRWFTASTELQLCGHGTLAAAWVLLQAGLGSDGQLRFDTLAGQLVARAAGEWVELDFPSMPPSLVTDARLVRDVTSALGFRPAEVLRNDLDVLAVAESEAQVRAVVPDLDAVLRLDARGLIVTAGSSRADADFVSRFFSPATGIPEDAVTGSAHCTLAPLWIDRLHRQPLLGHQVSARGGFVKVAMRDDRVVLAGTAVTLSEGTWRAGA
jgi:PhzF family phenazine biosynthesis protein